MLGLFLEGQGIPLPQHCRTKLASALSRFLNEYKWPTRQLIREVRKVALQKILFQPRVGRRLTLQVIIDLTTLEKAGKFKEFNRLVRVYNGKRGQHERNALSSSGTFEECLGVFKSIEVRILQLLLN